MSARPLPLQPKRIVLVNPTRYLGNLLIAGGLIQDFAALCQSRNIEFKLVIDEAFAQLFDGALPADSLLLYPRRRIKQANAFGKLAHYWHCLQQIRRFDADIAFNIEEDSVSHRLTQLSGAYYRLGCSTTRHQRGYEEVMNVDFTERPVGEQHRWHSFQQVFARLGLPRSSTPSYLRLPVRPLTETLRMRLQQAGIDLTQQQVVLHAGATKDYKKWPLTYYAQLGEQLRQPGRQVVFIGAGSDAREVAQVLQQIPLPHDGIVNLCNVLSLAELAHYFRHVTAMVGNDSGPFHLAAAQGVAGLVIFGPTKVELWGPLSPTTAVLKGTQGCSPECTRQQCVHQHRCLTSLTPELALMRLQPLLKQA
ncbi:MAG: glycosyltransferase family 9 protein [Pseudomonadota bacterium]